MHVKQTDVLPTETEHAYLFIYFLRNVYFETQER